MRKSKFSAKEDDNNMNIIQNGKVILLSWSLSYLDLVE